MQLRRRFVPILPLAVLGGLVLVGGLGSPAAAQDNTPTKTTTTRPMANPSNTTGDSYWDTYYALPEPLKYPEWSPGVINTLHWTDWTETNWAPGSTYELELDRMKAEREFWENRWKNDRMTSSP